MQKLELMDKILRELEDLKHSQTSVLKKIAQIEVDNIKSLQIVTSLLDEFQFHRDKFFIDNKLSVLKVPTV